LENCSQIIYTSISGFPLIYKGDDLAEIIYYFSTQQKVSIQNGDIFVIAQKIVSKSEGRMIDLRTIRPGLRARTIAAKVNKDPRLIELILSESKSVLRIRKGTIIVEHKKGFVCANAGIDHSNTVGGEDSENFVLLLPEDPDHSAFLIRKKLKELTGQDVGVLIIDSHGRAWRNGTIGTTIGISGFPALVDLRGRPDLFGYKLRVSQVATSDELAAGASLLMGQADESRPCIHVRGFPYQMRESSLTELIRDRSRDLFR
jgi:coenzyme F420-0:L-glutamate ligase/coenzyme F420-1:gamma-L-glutamate ligase